MKSCTVFCPLVLALAPAVIFAQGPPTQYPTNVCPAGIQPDGYVDWSTMPKPPSISYGSPSAPVTATLPVQGVPGLTVNVQIPALTQNRDQGTSSGDAYTAGGDTLTLNALTNLTPEGSPTNVTLTFNKPIQGLQVVGSSVGENPYNFSVTSDSTNAGLGAFGSTFSGTVDGSAFAQISAPLQLAATGAQITTVNLTINATYGEHGYQFVSWSDLRIKSGTAPDPSLQVPTDGLMQWLRADQGIANSALVYNQPASLWSDQSGNGHDASGPANTSPLLAYDGQHCQRTLSFNGSQFLNFTLPIAGWTQMTVFLVAKSDTNPTVGPDGSDNSAMFWNEDAYWGNTYVSPFQTHTDFRFGTTQVGNAPNYIRPSTIGGDFSVTTAVHNNSTDSLYVNGLEVLDQGGKLPALGGSDGTGFLGRGNKNTYYHGEISEVLVYNRVLTVAETLIVTSYLETKYGVH